MVSGSEDILRALEYRLNEIKREQRAECAAFEADPEHLEVPTDAPQRLDELESIRTAIAREQQLIASREPPTLPPDVRPEETTSTFGLEQPYTSAVRRTQTGRFAGGRLTTLVRDTLATGGPSTAISATAYGTTMLTGGHTGYTNAP